MEKYLPVALNDSAFTSSLRMGVVALKMARGKEYLTNPIDTADRVVGEILRASGTSGQVNRSTIISLGMCTFLCGRWAACGFPTVRMDHGVAASLMGTTVGKEAAEMVRAPWPAFVIRVPNNLVWLEDTEGIQREVTLAMVTEFDGSWWYQIITDRFGGEPEGLSIWAAKQPIATLLDESDGVMGCDGTMPVTSTDKRAETLCRRLILGTCLRLSENKVIDEARERPSNKRNEKGRRGDEVPDYTSFALRASVKVSSDVTQAVREYARVGGASPKVQSLVCGHWKQQAHGKGWAQRKVIHVAPYWRGPLGAPVSMKVK